MSQELFNSLTKEVFGVSKMLSYARSLAQEESFAEENPKCAFTHIMHCFLESIVHSPTRICKMHTCISMFTFLVENFEKNEKYILPMKNILREKAIMCRQEWFSDLEIGAELGKVADEVLALLEPSSYGAASAALAEVPVTPSPCSNAASVCPGAPRRAITRSMTNSTSEDVARELFPSSSEEEQEEQEEEQEEEEEEEEEEQVQTKRGEIYRAVSKEGVKSSVRCLEDNGALLEIRFGEKTGTSLWHMGRRVFANYADWQEELEWM